ncbi:MAG: hypothetical protein AAFU78_18990, partial [Cyanobacteria bacterium J06633_2]
FENLELTVISIEDTRLHHIQVRQIDLPPASAEHLPDIKPSTSVTNGTTDSSLPLDSSVSSHLSPPSAESTIEGLDDTQLMNGRITSSSSAESSLTDSSTEKPTFPQSFE